MKKQYFSLLILFVAVFIVFFSLQTKTTQSVACSLMSASVSPSSGNIGDTVAISWYAQACDRVDIALGGGNTASDVQSPYYKVLSGPPEQYTVLAYGYCNNPIDGPYFDGTYLCGQATVSVSAGPSIIHGVCGTTKYTCSSGTVSDQRDDAYGHWIWDCLGGTNPQGDNNTCSSNKASYTVTASAGSGCSATPASQSVYEGDSASVTFTANSSSYAVGTISGCTGAVTSNCSITAACNPVSTPVNCVGNWSACSNGSQTYTITTPAQNGGTACEATNGATRLCGTTAECAPTHYNCSVGTYAGDGTGGASGPWSWTCLGLNGGANIGCSESASPVVPTVSTGAASGITSNSASATGTISSNGGSTVTVSGCAWNTTGSPTTANSKTTNGWSIGGPYSCSLTGLSPSTTYYVRAYATNSVGTAYGNQISFITTAAMSGTVTPSASACTIVLGGNSCNVNLSWSTTNPVATSAVTSPYPVANTTVGSGNSGTVNGVLIPYNNGNGRDFYLYNNAQQLDFENVTANCGAYTWNGSMCTVGGAPLVNGTCSSPQAHYTCSAGTSINNVDGASTWTWSCQGSGGGSTASCSENKPVTPKPDLTADTPTPTTAVRNSTTTLSSTIFNIGNASTGASFPNFFQVCNVAGGCATPTDLSPTTMSALPFGANAQTIQTYSFPLVGTYSIRACADKSNSLNGEVIAESDENNNCSSPWVNVTVSSTGAGTWSAWSACVNGVKTRTCTPVNTCSGASSMACSTPKIKEN